MESQAPQGRPQDDPMKAWGQQAHIAGWQPWKRLPLPGNEV
ncbi:MAG: hypothetical protein OXJ37_03390 [Bryobacterales bacterium]|nr:hypothetical protein [Bryobacterales bacterium]